MEFVVGAASVLAMTIIGIVVTNRLFFRDLDREPRVPARVRRGDRRRDRAA
jgi:hypothetical protein